MFIYRSICSVSKINNRDYIFYICNRSQPRMSNHKIVLFILAIFVETGIRAQEDAMFRKIDSKDFNTSTLSWYDVPAKKLQIVGSFGATAVITEMLLSKVIICL